MHYIRLSHLKAALDGGPIIIKNYFKCDYNENRKYPSPQIICRIYCHDNI